MSNIWYLLIGFLAGWVVKTPFLMKYYRRIRKDREHMDRLYENIKNGIL
jgi:hypothetical protein